MTQVIEPADDFAARVTGVASLAEPVRRDLYLFVAAQPEPVSRERAAAGVGVALHAAKFHLDRLVEDGLLAVDYKRPEGRGGPGAGRPAKRYRRSGRQVTVALPERRYDLAGDLMATAIEESATDGTPVLDALRNAAAHAGCELGERVAARVGSRSRREDRVAAICAELAGCGFEPRRDDDAITLANCPFHELALEHTELVCGMNLALVGAALDRVGDRRLKARLDPIPDRCCVVIDTR